MKITNFEFKAKVPNLEVLEAKLQTLAPIFKGIDHQIDTYFNVPKGRLKLREGNIENALIQYDRANLAASKLSDIILYQHAPDPALKQILSLQFGVKVVVDKKRKIYFVENVKFHFDEVKDLGTFMEVEAIDTDNSFSIETLQQQCDKYMSFFEISPAQLLSDSYSDLLLAKNI